MADDKKVLVDVKDLELVSNAAIAWLAAHQQHEQFSAIQEAVLRLGMLRESVRGE